MITRNNISHDVRKEKGVLSEIIIIPHIVVLHTSIKTSFHTSTITPQILTSGRQV